MEKGKLYLIPNTLGDTPPLEVMPLAIKKAIERIDHYIVENEKTARHFIKKISSGKSQPNLKIELLNKFTDPSLLPSFLEPCLQGLDMGVISEAGCPGVADPGAEVVALAHEKGIQVVPLVGPSSILLALMASGLNGQQFAFSGYLPIDKVDRKKKLKAMERVSRDLEQTQIFIETPYRNDNLLTDLTKMLGGHTRLCVACDISLPTEYIKTMTVNEWKNEKVELHKRPAIFLFLA
ncbi:SAM-dependent methyltransferase [Sediminicola luteus]|uniref:SAM-dependent methyltransferase n=1 Tax=Sediminicola luteus TaxID=319238 RepID=A0A2A4G7C3_9FLAO|nr:SAM-dependent methyltransferase [Sediminicola luteus]PCE63652.1 SAM-dependent methyltransferase [Sediminicola luteus]